MVMKQRAGKPSCVILKNVKKQSVVQHQRDEEQPEKMRMDEVSENKTATLPNQTHLEQPSFRNVLSSTILSSSHSTSVQQQQVTETIKDNKIENSVFKVPLRFAIRRHKKASFITEPTLHSIAEESANNISWEGHTTDVSVSVQMDAITTLTSVTGNTTCIEISNKNNNKGTSKELPQEKVQLKATNKNRMLVHNDQGHRKGNTLSASTLITSTNGMFHLM